MNPFKSILFWLFFVIPMSLGIGYYLKIASLQYEASAHFTVEKHGKLQSDPLGALTGLPGGVSSTRDALIIKDFIESREVIERTRNDFDLKILYARSDKDWLSRLDEDASIEETVEYWQEKVTVEFDSTSGILELNVLAFEPEVAVTVIKSILKVSEELVNQLSEKSRNDSLKFARSELKNSELKLKEARTEVQFFVTKNKHLAQKRMLNRNLSW